MEAENTMTRPQINSASVTPTSAWSKPSRRTGVEVLTAAGTTTERFISSGLYLLLSHPDQWRALVEDRSLLGSAVEEILRYHHPTQSTSTNRRCTVDVPLRDKVLKAGDTELRNGELPLLSTERLGGDGVALARTVMLRIAVSGSVASSFCGGVVAGRAAHFSACHHGPLAQGHAPAGF